MTNLANDKFWFETEKSEVNEYVFATIKKLMNTQDYKRQDELRNFKLYSNQNALGYRVGDYTLPSSNNGLVFNVVQAITDTLVSKIGKSNPKITFLTDKGNWEMKKRAESLEMFISGQFYKTGLYNIAPKVLKRSCVFGSGFGKIYSEYSDLIVENTFPGEIWVDDREAIDGTTRTMYQVKYVPKVVLQKIYPDYAKQIGDSAEMSITKNYFSADTFYSQSFCAIAEAWRLPSRKGAKDGRHVICVEKASMVDEVWERNYFPLPHLRFSEKLLGFFGVGVSELLAGIQIEINKILRRIQQSIHINAVPRVFYEIESAIVKEHFSNDIGMMCGYKDTPPIISVSPSVSADVFNHLDRLYQKAFEIIGVSQLSVGSQKPAGLNSAVSIREYHDIESERFITLQSEYDAFHIECAKQFIDEAKEISKRDPKFGVMVKTQGGAMSVRWKDIDLDEDSYIMQIYPTNLLPQQPAGRLEKVIEMKNADLLNNQEAASLLDYPDVKSITTLKNAKIDDIMLTISKMIDDGMYTRPEPYQDLEAGIEYCQAFYLLYKHQKVSVERLDLLKRWIGDAQNLLTPPAPIAPPPAPGIPGQQEITTNQINNNPAITGLEGAGLENLGGF